MGSFSMHFSPVSLGILRIVSEDISGAFRLFLMQTKDLGFAEISGRLFAPLFDHRTLNNSESLSSPNDAMSFERDMFYRMCITFLEI